MRTLGLTLAGSLMLVLLAGCAALWPGPLEVPPGHRAVLGRVDLAGFEVPQATLDIVKEDGTFNATVSAGPGRRDFALALPPGRYRVTRIVAIKDRSTSSVSGWPLNLAFEVGPEPAIYIGTLRVGSTLGPAVRVSVVDEYEDTLRALRALYSDLPQPVTRRLMTPA